MKLGLQKENSIADICWNLGEFLMETVQLVLSIVEQPSRPAAFSVELCCVLKGARLDDVPHVGPARQESCSKLANLVFVWCRLIFCTGKIYICPIFGPNLGIIFHNRGTRSSL